MTEHLTTQSASHHTLEIGLFCVNLGLLLLSVLLPTSFITIIAKILLCWILPGSMFTVLFLDYQKYDRWELVCLILCFTMILNILIVGILILLQFDSSNFIYCLTNFIWNICGLIALVISKKTNEIRNLIKILFYKEPSLSNTGSKSSLNMWLLAIYLLLIGIFASIRLPITYSDDPWLYAFAAQSWVTSNQFLIAIYRGYYGMTLILTQSNYTLGIDFPMLIKYYPIFSVFLGGILIELLAMQLFKNRNFAILCSCVIIIIPLGFFVSINQVWATSLAVLLGVLMCIQHLEILSKNVAKKDKGISLQGEHLGVKYLIYVLIGLALIFTHDETSLVFIGLFVFLDFILYLKNRSKALGISLIVNLGLIGFIFLYGTTAGFFLFNVAFSGLFKPIYLLGTVLLIPLYFIAKYLLTLLYSPKNGFSIMINDTARKWMRSTFTFIKILILVMIFVVPPISIPLLEDLFFYNITDVFPTVFSTIILTIFGMLAIAGAMMYRVKNPEGNWIFLALLYFIVGTLALIVLDYLVLKYAWWTRLLLVAGSFMGLAAFSYLFMLFKSTLFSKKSILRFVEVLCIITVVSSLYYENNLIEYKTADELNTGRYLGVQSEQFPSRIITGFRWQSPMVYFSDNTTEVLWENTLLVIPQNQIAVNGTNLVQQFAQTNATNLFLLLDRYQIIRGACDVSEQNCEKTTPSVLASCLQINYLDRVMVSQQSQLFYVILNES